MDTNKIREAQALIDQARHRGHNIPQLVEAARLLQAKLDKAPKVLTDEIDAAIRIIRDGYCASSYQSYGMLRYSCCGGDFDNREHKYHCDAQAVLKRLEFARDNGYLAPASGLTVEEAEAVAMECLDEWSHSGCGNDSSVGWFKNRLRARLTAAIKNRLRARLTAAIEAKQNRKA